MISNSIVLRGAYELLASKMAAMVLKPGMLLSETSAGKLTAHATEGGYAERFICLDDIYQGKGVSDTIASGELAPAAIFTPGAAGQVLLAAGASVVPGDMLISAGNGKLKKLASVSSGVTVKQVICVVEETLDLTDSAAVDTLVAVRFI